MTVCYLGVGSNLGDRRGYIDKAIRLLGAVNGVKVDRVSSIYETDPVGEVPQGKFLNGVIEIETNLAARALLKELAKIEEVYSHNILGDMYDVVTQAAAEAGCAVVIDKTSILYGQPASDLTPYVLAKMKKMQFQ